MKNSSYLESSRFPWTSLCRQRSFRLEAKNLRIDRHRVATDVELYYTSIRNFKAPLPKLSSFNSFLLDQPSKSSCFSYFYYYYFLFKRKATHKKLDLTWKGNSRRRIFTCPWESNHAKSRMPIIIALLYYIREAAVSPLALSSASTLMHAPCIMHRVTTIIALQGDLAWESNLADKYS